MEGRRYRAAEMIARQVAIGTGAIRRIHRHGERPLEAQHGRHDLAPNPGQHRLGQRTLVPAGQTSEDRRLAGRPVGDGTRPLGLAHLAGERGPAYQQIMDLIVDAINFGAKSREVGIGLGHGPVWKIRMLNRTPTQLDKQAEAAGDVGYH